MAVLKPFGLGRTPISTSPWLSWLPRMPLMDEVSLRRAGRKPFPPEAVSLSLLDALPLRLSSSEAERELWFRTVMALSEMPV